MKPFRGRAGNQVGRRPRPPAPRAQGAPAKQTLAAHPRLAAHSAAQLPQRPWERTVAWQQPRAQQRGVILAPLRVYAPVQEAASTADRRDSNGSASSSNGSAGSGRSSRTDSTLTPSEGSGLPVLSLSTPQSGRELVPTVSSADILQPVREDMEVLASNLRTIVGKRHPLLMAAAQQIFGAGGKKLRPAIVLLMARATAKLAGMRCAGRSRSRCSPRCVGGPALTRALPCSDIHPKHRRLAEITEMIHTASLVHDDVVDNASVRRGGLGLPGAACRGRLLGCTYRRGAEQTSARAGKTTVNSLYGTRVAVLAGDYLFAQSSWHLAQLDNLEVGSPLRARCPSWLRRPGASLTPPTACCR